MSMKVVNCVDCTEYLWVIVEGMKDRVMIEKDMAHLWAFALVLYSPSETL